MDIRKTELPELEERYFTRMASSVGDKSRLLQYLPPILDENFPPKILDVGAGGGEFAYSLATMGYDVTALDASDEAVERINFKYSSLKTIQALANHTHDFGLEKYDVIICSSILHEVFSYGDNIHKAGHVSSLNRALESFYKALKPGGTLLIRDGVKPDNWEQEASFTLLEGHEVSSVFKYLEMCPFANGAAYGSQGRLVQLNQTGDKTFIGNVQSVMEFAYTYTWGLDSYTRETQELYAPLTLDEYVQLLETNGFHVTTSFSYLQPGYPTNLDSKMVLEVEGKPAEWFDSNAIWVANKF